MTTPGERTSNLGPAEPWEVDDDDEFLVLDKSDTTSPHAGAGGTLKPITRAKAISALLNKRSPAVRVSLPLPQRLYQAQNLNAQAFSYNRMWTSYDSGTNTWFLYVVYIDKDRKQRVARRNLLIDGIYNLGTGWTAGLDLSSLLTAYATVDKNEHRFMNVARDGDGYIHILAPLRSNQGNLTGRYIWSTSVNPNLGNISQFAAGSMDGTNEANMAYPIFVRRSDNKLLLFYRESVGGNAGDGYIRVKLYSHNGTAPSSGKWSMLHNPLVDGHNDANGARGPYLWNIIRDRRPGHTSRIGVFMCERVLSTDFNEKLAYFESLDDGVTWQKIDGTAITLPFTWSTHYTGAAIVDNITAQSPSTFINQGGACYDSNGVPHVIYYKNVSGFIWPHISYHNGTTWVNKALPQSMIGIDRRPTIIPDDAGHVFPVFTLNLGGRQDSIWAMDATSGTVPAAGVEQPLLDMDVGRCELAHCEVALQDTKQALWLVTNTGSLADDDTTSPELDYHHRGYILNADINRLQLVTQGLVQVPRFKILASVQLQTAGPEIVVTQTTVGEISPSVIPLDDIYGGMQLHFRYVVGVKVDSGSTITLKLAETTDGGSPATTQSGDFKTANTTYGVHASPWMPLQSLDGELLTGFLSMHAGITTGSGAGYIKGVLQLSAFEPIGR
jgi:hypothetical protein